MCLLRTKKRGRSFRVLCQVVWHGQEVCFRKQSIPETSSELFSDCASSTPVAAAAARSTLTALLFVQQSSLGSIQDRLISLFPVQIIEACHQGLPSESVLAPAEKRSETVDPSKSLCLHSKRN
ncbi:hypothetical protein SLA2020_277530 [Shorea laevis]